MNEEQKQDIQEEVADIAEAIVRIAEVGEIIRQSRLRQRTVVLLLHDITKVKKSDITYVLNALPHLKDYIKR